MQCEKRFFVNSITGNFYSGLYGKSFIVNALIATGTGDLLIVFSLWEADGKLSGNCSDAFAGFWTFVEGIELPCVQDCRRCNRRVGASSL